MTGLSFRRFAVIGTFIGIVLHVCDCAMANGYTIDPPIQSWFRKAPPLPEPQGQVIRVSTVDELLASVESIKPGGTILVAEGHYPIPRYFEIRTDDVTLRGATGNPADVVLDGGPSQLGELLGFRNCSGVTVADLTVQNVKWNGIKINSETNVQRLTIYHCIIHNVWERGVKGVRVPETNRESIRPKGVRIQYCLFYNDRAKRFSDDDKDTPKTFNGNYIGGIDAMHAKGWTISDNVFVNIQGRTREGRGCVFLWHHAEDIIVERNVILNCDVGIALGNSSGIGEGMSQVHCTHCTVRNNFITNTPETGILADYTQDCRVLNNTIHHPQNRLRRLIRIVHANNGLQVVNNLLSGPDTSVENESEMDIRNNLVQDLTACFIDPENGNLHLQPAATGAIDKAIILTDVKNDFDDRPRSESPDIGADEYE